MFTPTAVPRAWVALFVRGIVGWGAGFIIACYGLTFFDVLPWTNDLSQPELDQRDASLRLAIYAAWGCAGFSMLAGRKRISRYWLWFALAFGVICVVPVWPGKGHGLLPFGTFYVHYGHGPEVIPMLAIHVAVAALIAAGIKRVFPKTDQRPKADGDLPTTT